MKTLICGSMADGNFIPIAHVVQEGSTACNNIRKAIVEAEKMWLRIRRNKYTRP